MSWSSALDDIATKREAAAKEKAEKAAYDASPDIESSSIITLIESPHLQVTIKDIAGFPNGKILVNAQINGGRCGTKLAVFSTDGRLDHFTSQSEENDYFRDIIIVSPNGDFSLIDEMRDYPDYSKPWDANEPGILRNKHGKIIAAIKVKDPIKFVNFDHDGKLHGIEWNENSATLNISEAADKMKIGS